MSIHDTARFKIGVQKFRILEFRTFTQRHVSCKGHCYIISFQERFPPNIYYKIFTHRPIQDMCSNSPKDYTKAEVKLQMTRDKHNATKTRPLPGPDSK